MWCAVTATVHFSAAVVFFQSASLSFSRRAVQLFFDASHTPCKGQNDTKTNPKRVSIWEIHPVYHFEVCKFKTLAACPANDNSKWDHLHNKFNTSQENDGETQ
jgi:hypothetical protein